MRPTPRWPALLLVFALVAGTRVAAADPAGTAFGYQGRLDKAGAPFTGPADFNFRLYDAAADGAQVGGAVALAGVPVDAGLFTVELDFGAVYDGTALWLEVDVQTAGDGGFTTLAPRTPVLAVPYAVRALDGPGGGSPWIAGPFGIEYAGNVGIGLAAAADRRLHIDAGAANANPLVVTNDSPGYAAVAVANAAIGGIGLYDATSDRHFVEGDLGIGTPNPAARVEVVGYKRPGVVATMTGGSLTNPVAAAIVGVGNSNSVPFPETAMGVYGRSTDSRGVWGVSTNDWGVTGECSVAGTFGVLGTQNEAVFGYSPNPVVPAAKFINGGTGGVALEAQGLAKVRVLQITGGADLAEPFDVAAVADAAPSPGTVVIIDGSSPGGLRVSDAPYDSRVAGVISGANGLAPGMVMTSESDPHARGAHPVALTGRVWCRVDADRGPVRPGDLLTTSATPGHAMRASDPARRAGAVIGKAMTSLEAGRGLVLVLVNLQ